MSAQSGSVVSPPWERNHTGPEPLRTICLMRSSRSVQLRRTYTPHVFKSLHACSLMRTSAVVSYLYFLAAAAIGVSATVFGLVADSTCPNGREAILTETFIGEARHVKVIHSRCDDGIPARRRTFAGAKRQNATQTSQGVCGAQCQTFCWTPGPDGPSANDCTVIADALLYESQNDGPVFDVAAKGTPANKVTMKYGTCETYFYNKLGSTSLTYCREDWSQLVTWLSQKCVTSSQDTVGLCVDKDQRWFVQYELCLAVAHGLP
ncbi:hypothetical protein OH77DRAFT_643612 [Trametes cingulata]|nr:hypothetical protein OH77DRAFT_643612 [Trametes cingulata]